MNTTLRALAAGILLGMPALAGATQVAFHPLVENLPICSGWLGARSATDMDGDGRNDLVLGCSISYESWVINVLGLDGSGQLVEKRTWTVPYGDVSWPPMVWHDSTGGHVGLRRPQGLERWSGWPPRNEGFVPFAGLAPSQIDPATTVIADIDGDGAAEMPILAQNPLRIDVYAVPSGALRWSVPLEARGGTNYRLQVLQLDADPALELLVTGTSGHVVMVDGATRSVDYQIAGRLDTDVAVAGRFLPASGGLLDAVGQRWTLYRTTPWQEMWWNRTVVAAGTPQVGDINGDGIDEIVFRAPGSRDVVGMAVTENAPRVVADLGDRGSLLGLADISDDGRAKILVDESGNGLGCRLTAWDGVTATIRFQFQIGCQDRIAGPFLHDASGAATDIVMYERNTQSFLRRVNVLTGATVWTAPTPIPEFQGSVWAVAAFRGHDGNAEIIASAPSEDYGWMVFHDATTGAHKRTLQIGGPGLWVAPREFALRTDAQGAPYSLVTCMSDGRVREFRYDTGAHLWTMPDAGFGCRNVWFDDGAVVASGSDTGLIAYDAGTHQLRWQTPSGLVSWRVMPIRPAGSSTQYLFVDGTDVHVFDPPSQQVVRSFPLPARLSAHTGVQDIVLPPGGDIHGLIVRSHDGVAVIDGITGELRTGIDHLAHHSLRHGALSVGSTGTPGRHLVAAIGNSAWWTFALDLPPDRIFAGGFDP